jgi:peptidoglycan/xylan/chitin deacetylase (PgdA/CDA1 family)
MSSARARSLLPAVLLTGALTGLPALAAANPPAAAGGAKPIRIALRYDDCSSKSPASLEDALLAASARYGIPLTFGVIPDPEGIADSLPAGGGPLPAVRAAKLQAAARSGSLEIALHGCSHLSRRPGRKSEFAGVDARAQDSLVARGLAALRPLEPSPRTFIPPWNAYDGSTLAALHARGFRTLSALAGGPLRSEGHPAALAFVPATCLLDETRAAVAEARRRGGGVIVPYFHPYEFKEIDAKRGFLTLAGFDSLLAWIGSQGDVEATTLGALGEAAAAAPSAYAAYSRWHTLTPSGLERFLRPAYRVYPEAGFPVAGGGLWLRLAVLAGFAVAAAPAYALGRLLSRGARTKPRRRGFPSASRALSLLAGLIAIAVGFREGEPFSLWLGLAAWAYLAGWRPSPARAAVLPAAPAAVAS